MSAPQHGRPPLDGIASEAIAAARARAGIGAAHRQSAPPLTRRTLPVPRTLTVEELRDAQDLIQRGKVCRCCAGLHPGGDLACPRLASFDLDGDGQLRAGTYWPDGSWDTDRVLFAAEVTDDDSSHDESGRRNDP